MGSAKDIRRRGQDSGNVLEAGMQRHAVQRAIFDILLNSTQLNAKNGRRRNAPLYPYL